MPLLTVKRDQNIHRTMFQANCSSKSFRLVHTAHVSLCIPRLLPIREVSSFALPPTSRSLAHIRSGGRRGYNSFEHQLSYEPGVAP
jgi:hypothetical protein